MVFVTFVLSKFILSYEPDRLGRVRGRSEARSELYQMYNEQAPELLTKQCAKRMVCRKKKEKPSIVVALFSLQFLYRLDTAGRT
jgi:hypothetical protein